jgi:hypothetical protein
MFSLWALLFLPSVAGTAVPLLEPFTLTLPNASIPNASLPFNCTNLNTAIVFTSPSGRTITALPFFTQDFVRTQSPGGDEVLSPAGAPYFAARFAPAEAGLHTYRQVGAPAGVPPLNGTFACAGGPARPGDGFARVARGGAHFTLNDSEAFWLVGENMAWAGCWPYFNGSCAIDNVRGGTYAFDRLLARLASVGGNWIRLWLGPSLVRNPTLNGEVGSFLGMALLSMGAPFASYNLAAAWRINYVIDLARALGVKVTVVLEAQQTFDLFWGDSAYNAANGGPLEDASALWASAPAVAEFEQRWDYTVSRYAHSSSVFSWELQNESNDWPGKFSAAALAVQLGLLARIRALDPYHHLVQNSFSGVSGSAAQIDAFQSDPRVAFTVVHAYPNPAFTLPCDVAATVWRMVAPLARRYAKPSFLEEFGASYVGPEQHALDPRGVGLRTGAWASLVGGAAGTAMQWYWAEVETLDTYSQLSGAGAVARLLARELLAADWASTPGAFSPPAAAAHAGWTLGRAPNGTQPLGLLAYAYNANFTQCGTSKVIASPTAGAVLRVPGLGAPPAGAPPLAPLFFNTTTGSALPAAAGGSAVWDASGALTVTFPEFSEDAAVYVNLTATATATATQNS